LKSFLILIVFIIYNISAQTVIVFIEKKTNEDKFAKFEKDMISSFITFFNLESNSKYKLNFIEMTLNETFIKMQKYTSNDNILAINSLSVTDERKLKFDFSTPYMINRPIILKSKKNKNPKDLENIKSVFGTIKGSIYERILINDLKNKNQKYILTNSMIELIEKLKNGSIDFIYSDYVNIWSFDLESVKEIDTGDIDQIAILFPKNSILRKSINTYFETFIKSGTYMSLIKKHFGEAAINYFQRGLKKYN
jgi:hypothetical protein